MPVSAWPDWLDGLWAKSPEKGHGARPESLAQHTWNVLARLTEMVNLRPCLPAALGVPRLWHLLFWATCLHDFGKSAGGFQAMLRGGPKWPHRHEVLSLAFLDWIAPGLTADEQPWVAAGIVFHHKDPSEIETLYPPPDDFEEDQLAEVARELPEGTVQGLWRWLGETVPIWIADLKLHEVGVQPVALPAEPGVVASPAAAAARIHHWLQVCRRFTRQVSRSDQWPLILGTLSMRGYLINADHIASAHAAPIHAADLDAGSILARCGLRRDSLFLHQAEAETTDRSALLVAPTGSGKTEAALLWASRLAHGGQGCPRLFYTLPYQASMNAMYRRLDSIFPHQVGLQHGRSLLALYRLLIEHEPDPAKAAQKARWSANMVTLHHNPVCVFSPYQMLKGMYRLKGYEASLCDYQDAAFVVDEIHAYEVQRLALILKTIEYLVRHFGARFLVMSATFPTLIKGWLRQVLGACAEISAEPLLFEQFQRHRLCLLDGELLSAEGFAHVEDDACQGKSVLVVCNLVDHAQAAYVRLCETLGAKGVPVELLHGRFNMQDRSAKERLVREATGSTSQTRRPIVLVATQVVEVSLDIDLDTIYTEPAPLEALVQRFGRVNRRGRQPALAPVYVYSRPTDGQRIYQEQLIGRTLGILRRETGRPLDESAVGDWVDEVYHGTLAAEWESQYRHAAAEFDAACVQTLRAFRTDESLEELFYRAFDGVEVLPLSLRSEHDRLSEEEPIRANELLVPISWSRYSSLSRQGRVLPREPGRPPVIRARYDADLGLSFGETEDIGS